MRRPSHGWLLFGAVLATLGSGIAETQALLERQRPPSAMAAELSYLPKGEYLKVAVLGYERIMADLIWIRAVQHFGDLKQTPEGYVWAYHAADVVTDLDPKFVFAYQAAGTVLGVWAGKLDESTAILKKGMRHNPTDWHLPFMLGYDYYYELCDPVSAAKFFRVASELPGAPVYLPRLAARMTVEAGDPAAALEFLDRLYQQTGDTRIREALEVRMREIIIEQHLRVLEEGIGRYRDRFNKYPHSIQELQSSGILAEIPQEPFGGEYRINAPDKRVVSSSHSQRLRVHRHLNGCYNDIATHARE